MFAIAEKGHFRKKRNKCLFRSLLVVLPFKKSWSKKSQKTCCKAVVNCVSIIEVETHVSVPPCRLTQQILNKLYIYLQDLQTFLSQ